MRRSRSGTPRMSTINSAPLVADKIFPDIHDSKWSEMMLEEENDMFILEIREEIIEKSLQICYENYMERQAVAFTVHCAYLAWVKVINVYYMPRDQGDEEDKDVKESWEPDEEPESSVIDSWATQFMTTSKDPPVAKESEITSLPTAMASETARSDTIKSVPSVYYPEGGGYEDDEYGYPREFAGESLELFLPRRKSIFTRSLSMPREFLPLFEPLNLGLGQCKDETSNFKKKIPEDVFQPTYIDVSNVQSNRLGKRQTGRCRYCGDDNETVDHVLSRCPQWIPQRVWLCGRLGIPDTRDLDLRSLLSAMLESEEKWTAADEFALGVLRAKLLSH